MGFLGDQAEKAAEHKVYAQGGYPALFKFKAMRMYAKVRSCSCCS